MNKELNPAAFDVFENRQNVMKNGGFYMSPKKEAFSAMAKTIIENLQKRNMDFKVQMNKELKTRQIEKTERLNL